ncbi:MAG: hypothetical protein CMI02_00560 [Oceanospirillaceae bacterium]|nr:hypothetical protein [Oceanospirillaceae bacterium]MBT10510.1 hypothetical protein [Oceanospirillaceae bacterium]|tara:strand:- start:90641 stop:91351 length:711 start_codon:yes stop_codon:yes gene_type:complete
MIRTLSLLVTSLWLLSGCTVYHSLGDSFGSYVSEPDGQNFKPVGYRWDYEHTALVYIYRPASEWAMDELESPSFNIDDERLFNMKGGGYTWYEFEPGRYDVAMRRGLLGLEGVKDVFVLKEISRLELQVKAGEVYYLRYSEIDPPPSVAGQTPLGDGPLQLVDAELAMNELPVTRMMHHGRGRLQPAAPQVADAGVTETAPGGMNAGALPATGGAAPASEHAAGKDSTKDEGWWPF